jgi:hypothetical protein
MQGAHTRQLLVQIGSRYEGPRLDRPALRQMPRHWKLETEEKPRVGMRIVIVAGLAYLVLLLWAFR